MASRATHYRARRNYVPHARYRIAIDPPIVYALVGAVIECLPTNLNIHEAILVATARVFQDVLSVRTAVAPKEADITASGWVDVLW